MADYGYDMQMTNDGDLTPTLLDEPSADLAKVALRRLSTSPGGLLSAPNEETIDLRDFLSADLPPGQSGFGYIKAKATGALLADPRFFSVQITGSMSADGHSLTLIIDCVGASGPFQLTVSVNRLTVSLLKSA